MFTSRTVTLRLPVYKNDNSNIFRRLPMFQSSVIFGILTGSKLLGIEILKQSVDRTVSVIILLTVISKERLQATLSSLLYRS